ncbi:MAG: ABC transporter ATP-binding protein [Bacilli bacterium]|nr:ABC transporter ATP-binding protein [Bacilli bacterium]
MNNGRKHGPQIVGVEKPKDLKMALIKLFKSLNKYKNKIFVALLLAVFGSILTLIAPNKLSDLVDEISKGLFLNKEKLEIVTKEITSNISEDSFKIIVPEILDLKIDQTSTYKILNSNIINQNDKDKYMDFLNKLKVSNDLQYTLKYILELPTSITNIILPISNYNGIEINTEDKILFINIMNEDKESIDLKSMPNSINKILFPESIIENRVITTKDKVSFISVMSSIDEEYNVNELYSNIDKLPINIKEIIEPKINLDIVKYITVFLIIVYLLNSIFSYTGYFIMTTVANRYAKGLRTKISNKINKLPLKYFDNNTTGDVLSRVTNDVDMISQSLNQSLDTIVSSAALLFGSLIMMFYTNWIMAITAIISSLFGFVFMAIVLKKSQKYFFQRQENLGKLNGHIEEIYSGLNVVKVYNGVEDSNKQFDLFNKEVYETSRKSQFFSGLMQPMMIFIGNFGYVAVCIVGALLTMNDVISFGVIVAFIMYVRLFTQPMARIAQALTTLQGAAASTERVFEFVDEKEMIDESNIKKILKRKDVEGNIEFENVSFGYEEDKTIIKDFSAKALPGQKIAIVGPTGAGKTTMVNLLMKFYDVNNGDIKIDGKSIKELKRENVHSLFTMVLQDTWLFNGTIKENIIYNHKDVDDETLQKICETVGIDHFIKTLPNGYDSLISDNDSVSAGQRQLLTIARGMINNAPLLILDEATSNVDTRTEELVQKAMDKITEGKTSFIIAHRLSTIKNADLILVMKDGNIIEQGKHKDLINKNGFYAELYNSQFTKQGIN